MSIGSNITVGFVALATTLFVIPSSMVLVRDSIKARKAIAALRTPSEFQIRDSHILDPALYDWDGPAENSARDLTLVSIVSNLAQAEAALHVWESVKNDPLIKQTRMTPLLSGIGRDRALGSIAGDIAVNHVKNPEEFSIRTGIRVVPFSLILARGGSVVAAGPGLPDVPFVRDAAERFIRNQQGTLTQFRKLTVETNASLTAIETMFPATADGQ